MQGDPGGDSDVEGINFWPNGDPNARIRGLFSFPSQTSPFRAEQERDPFVMR